MFDPCGVFDFLNPVGYSNRPIEANVQKMTSGDFVGIASQGFALKELKVIGEGVEGTLLWWMLPSGAFQTATWGWVFTDENGVDLPEEDIYMGWYDSESFNAVNYNFKAGEGFFVKGSGEAEGSAIVSSGALYTSDSTLARIGVEITANVQEISSNPMPGGTMNTDQIIVTGDEVEGTLIWWMLPSGAFQTATWGWVFTDENGVDLPEEDIYMGWYDSESFNAVHYDLKSGESFFVKPSGETQNGYLSYPNPLYVAPKD